MVVVLPAQNVALMDRFGFVRAAIGVNQVAVVMGMWLFHAHNKYLKDPFMENVRDILIKAQGLKQQGRMIERQQVLRKGLDFYPQNTDLITAYIFACFAINDYPPTRDWVFKLRDLMGGKMTPLQHMAMRHYITRMAEWSWYEEELKWMKNHIDTCPVTPFYLCGLPLKLSDYKKIMKTYYHQSGLDKVPIRRFDFSNRHFSNRKIKIGFVSANWRCHPEIFQTPTFYGYLNSDEFQVYFYDNTLPNEKDMPYKQKIIQISPKTYKNVSTLSDTQLADLIFFDQIDILVDLGGMTTPNRNATFIQQPAPIQVSWLGYPETLGSIPGHDYIIADSFVIPPDKRAEYPEKLLYLEPSYYPYDEFSVTEQFNVTRSELGLPKDAVVFACAGQDYKLTPNYFKMWMRILKQVPDSVLWLYALNPVLMENLQRRAEENGVNPKRIVFFSYLEHQKYMSALKCVDVMLDTELCGLHTTATDALFMGVPVLTCPGERWVARVCGSILNAMGLPELIATTPEQYEEKAVYWGTHPKELKKLKERVVEQAKSSDFFNSQVYARKFETLCREMICCWEEKQI